MENSCQRLKRYRRIGTRCADNHRHFLNIDQLADIIDWLK
jgi:hypothetical protein